MSSQSAANPLLESRFQIPFDRIRAEHVESAVQELLREAFAAREALAGASGERTFDNTMLGLDAMTERLDVAMAVVRHLESVATYPELRAAYNAVQADVSAFYSGIPLHEGLWNAIRRYDAAAEAGGLAGARKRFLKKTIDEFRRHGAELGPTEKARLAEIDPLRGKVIVDVGCGLTPYLADSMFQACRREGIEFYGIDPKIGQGFRFGAFDIDVDDLSKVKKCAVSTEPGVP